MTAPVRAASHPDGKRSKLRGLVDTMDTAVGEAASPLRTAWLELVAAMDLGPEPETKTCPACGSIGMRAASRCGHCWATLA